jgi:hypothetical protein
MDFQDAGAEGNVVTKEQPIGRPRWVMAYYPSVLSSMKASCISHSNLALIK